MLTFMECRFRKAQRVAILIFGKNLRTHSRTFGCVRAVRDQYVRIRQGTARAVTGSLCPTDVHAVENASTKRKRK